MYIYVSIDTKKHVKVLKFRHTYIYINIRVFIWYVNTLHCSIFDFINLLFKLAIKLYLILQSKAQLLLKKIIMHFEALIVEISCSVQVANMSTS